MTESTPPSISLMDLISASNGHPSPRRTVVYGRHGIGKTTYACSSESPVLLPFEDGYGSLHVYLKKTIPVLTFPDDNGKKKKILTSYDEAMMAIQWLGNSDHSFKHVVVDSAEAYETLCEIKVAKEHGKNTVAEIPFGKGFEQSTRYFTHLLNGLDYLAANKDMGIIVIAHAEVVTFNNPEGDNYDRYSVRLDKRNAPVLLEWADEILFCHEKTIVKRQDAGFGKTESKAVGTPERCVFTTGTAAFEAKNRLGMPDRIPMDWSVYEKYIADSNKMFLGEMIPDGAK